jgi:6-phosphogluconolactonase
LDLETRKWKMLMPNSIKVSRRFALSIMTAALLASPVVLNAKPAVSELIYVGMHGTKIHAGRFDPVSGDLSVIGPVADDPRPTWAVRHPTLPIVYFNNESGNAGNSEGTVQALRIDPKSGALTKISEMHSGGGGTTNLWFDAPSMTILIANYGGGSIATMPVRADGSLGEPVSVVKMTGSGPHRRQASPHPHGITVDPSGKFALVSDLGSDRVFVFPFDRKTRKLGVDDPAQSRHFILPPGTGPRHMAFHPGGRTLYLITEFTADVQVLGWDAKAGRLARKQVITTDDPAYTGDKSAAEIAVSKDGRFVYASNRGDHALVIYSVDQKTGMLTQIQRLPSGGPWPWHFTIHKSGKWMLVANRDANALSLFSIDRATGKLSNTGKTLASPKPVFAIFADR